MEWISSLAVPRADRLGSLTVQNHRIDTDVHFSCSGLAIPHVQVILQQATR